MDEVASQVVRALTERLGSAPQPGVPIIELISDSLAFAEFLFDLEQKYGIKVDEYAVAEATAEELAQYVQAKLDHKAPGKAG